MSALTLRLRECPRQRIDLSGFTSDALAGKSLADIQALPLWVGNRQMPAGDLFIIHGHDSDHIRIESESDRLDGIGSGMTRGSIRIQGRAGAYLGRGMRGGEIQVEGDAGLFAGTGMTGGLLRIGGNAGDFLGAAIPGERRGLRGGRIEVRGNAGERVGDRQRRGIILIAGDAGDYCGSRMGAGTILVLGRTGANVGFAMRRGTILLTSAPELPPTFNDNGPQDLSVLTLLAKSLPSPFDQIGERGTRVQRWLGDLGHGGQGEVLAWPPLM